jgi:hypothetical protein
MATNPTKRLLPVGIQDFPDIRERGFVYVDKTARAYELITGSGKAFFLSRPRRFGKSLLCSTLGAIFEGRRELFGEIAGRPALAVNSLDWEWKAHPVIYLDLNPGDHSKGTDVLSEVLQSQLENAARRYKVALRGQFAPVRFGNLIVDLHERFGEKAVVIIDEYDKPLTSTLDKQDVHIELRDALKAFYGVLKSYDAHLRFVFITGVSKFSHVSIFSDLNQLTDLTLDPRYADICGLTQDELEADFGPEIGDVLEKTGRNREVYLDELRRFYNGYRFSKAPLTVYNVFGLLKHFNSGGEFSGHWYESGTPSFLVELIAKRKINILELGNMQVRAGDFGNYDIDNMLPAPLLCQTGYLTIAAYDEKLQRFTLDYPNEEVRASFAESLVKHALSVPPERADALYIKLTDALYAGDVDAALSAIKHFLSAVPYELISERERYFQTVVHLIFAMLGFDCRTEEKIATGRIDMVVKTPDFVYCFEFKLDGSAKAALAQIDGKEYAVPWTGGGKRVFKVGVNFDSKKKNIKEWVSEPSSK